MREDVKCPYCGYGQDINHDDGYGYEKDVKHQQECGSCGKTFVYTTSIIFYYDTEKADCLNNGKHKYEPTISFPKCCTRMRSIHCDEEREPTDKERLKYGIPTKEEYFRTLKEGSHG